MHQSFLFIGVLFLLTALTHSQLPGRTFADAHSLEVASIFDKAPAFNSHHALGDHSDDDHFGPPALADILLLGVSSPVCVPVQLGAGNTSFSLPQARAPPSVS